MTSQRKGTKAANAATTTTGKAASPAGGNPDQLSPEAIAAAEAAKLAAAADAEAAKVKAAAEKQAEQEAKDKANAQAAAQAQAQAAAKKTTAVKPPVVAKVGPDAEANAEALEELLTGRELPLTLKVTNRMPRNLSMPQIKGFHAGHCAGPEAARSSTFVLREEGALQRVVVDIQALCKLCDYVEGVELSIVPEAD